MDNSIILLGNSQTFLGVISTLIILCIAKNQNNFMYSILDKIRTEIIKNISIVKPKISFKDIKANSSYKTINLYLKKGEHLDGNKAIDNSQQLQADLESEILNYQEKILDWDTTYKQYADNVERKTEQENAPLFAFAFSIVVFMLDEFLRCSYFDYKIEALLFLSYFSILTLLFWTIKWLMFLLLPLRPNNVITKNKDTDNCHLKINSIQILLHYVITVLCLVSYNKIFKPSLDDFSTFIIFNAIWLIIYVLFGLIHSLNANQEESERRALMHYVYHFIYMLIFSFILVVFINIVYPQLLLQLFFLDCNKLIVYIKLMIWINVLFWGFISPFALPFIRYNLIYIKAVLRSSYIYLLLWKSKHNLSQRCKIIASSIDVE